LKTSLQNKLRYDYEYLKNGSIDFLHDYHKDLYLYKHKISLEKWNWVENAVKKKNFFMIGTVENWPWNFEKESELMKDNT
jgi:hypothetical protein